MAFDLKSYFRIEYGRPATTRVAGLVVALSLANLSYLRIWDLLLHNPQSSYLTSVPYGRVDYFAALLGVLLLTLLLYLLINLVWHHGNRWHRALAMLGVFVVFILPLDFVRRSGGASIEVMTGISRYVIIGTVGLGLFTLALFFRQRFWAVVFWALAICSPYVLFTFGHATARIVDPEEIYPRRILPAPSAPAAVRETRRLIWVIFDEWDQTILFERRPKELSLPVLDALVKESVVVSPAYAPAMATMVSVPSLLQGRQLAGAFGTGDSRLQVRLPGETGWSNFRDGDSIVTDVLALPAPAVVLGWYHPYDRILPQSPLLQARSYGFPAFEGIRGEGLVSTVLAQYAYMALPIYGRMECRDLYLRLHADALQVVADSSVRFAFLHYGIPHVPGIFDARKQDLTVALSSEQGGYVGNLALVDRTLGELLAALDRSGLRESTALVLTADHWWRSAPWVKSGQGYPVPLIIQARKGDRGIQVKTPFATTGLRAIARSLLTGGLNDNREVAQAVSRQAVAGEVRYVDGVAEVRPKPVGASPQKRGRVRGP